MYASMQVCMYASMHVCMYVDVNACMFVCVCLCAVYLNTYMLVHVWPHLQYKQTRNTHIVYWIRIKRAKLIQKPVYTH